MMKGLVAKHIERRSFWHGANDIHWKLMMVKLEGQPVMKLRDAEAQDSKKDKRFPLHTLSAIRTFKNGEVGIRQQEKIADNRRRSNSTSVVSKLISSVRSQQTTKFTYGIELTINDRSLLFFLNTKEEFSNWTRLFKLIVEMNERRIPVTLINPWDYE